MERFKKMVDDLTIEFDDYSKRYGTGLTCEFATNGEDFEDKVDYINNKMVHNGYWHIMRCDTCKGYDSKRHWHVQIVDAYSWENHHSLIRDLKRKNIELERVANDLIKDMSNKEYYKEGTLANFIDLFECVVDTPEQYDEYCDATLYADLANPQNREDKNKLNELLKLEEDTVVWDVSRDITIEKDGTNNWNMFSECNSGCVAYVHMSHFTQAVGKRFRITVGLLPDRD